MDENIENTTPLTEDENPAGTEENPPVKEENASFFNRMFSHLAVRITFIIAGVILLLAFLFSVPVFIAPALQHAWGTSRAECRADSSLLTG